MLLPHIRRVTDHGIETALRSRPRPRIPNPGIRRLPVQKPPLGRDRPSTRQQWLQFRGVPAARLETISYGKEKSAVLGSTDASWAQNRRAVLALE